MKPEILTFSCRTTSCITSLACNRIKATVMSSSSKSESPYHHDSSFSSRPSLSPSINSILNPMSNEINHGLQASVGHGQEYFFQPPTSPTSRQHQNDASFSSSAADTAAPQSSQHSHSTTHLAHSSASESCSRPSSSGAPVEARSNLKRPRSNSAADDGVMQPPPPRRDSCGTVPQQREFAADTSSQQLAQSNAASQSAQHSVGHRQAPRIEPSVFNIEPIDEFTREVADWLWGFCSQLPWEEGNVEVSVTTGTRTATTHSR